MMETFDGPALLRVLQIGIAALLIIAGALFCIAGAVGVLRFPDVYTRCHAAGLSDTAGAGLVIAGLMLLSGPTHETLKLGLAAVFLAMTAPVAAHAIANAARSAGLEPTVGRWTAPKPAAPPEEQA